MMTKRDRQVRSREKNGALGGIRTPDTWFRRPVLYPLSYERVRFSQFTTRVPFGSCVRRLLKG